MLSTLISNIIVLKWLAPIEAGIWSALTLTQSYFSFMQLGVYSGLNREYPYLLGKGQLKSADAIIASSLAFALILSCMSPFVFYAVFIKNLSSEYYTIAVPSFAFSMGLISYQQYLSVTYRTNKDFNSLSRIYAYQSFFTIGSVVLVTSLGFKGLCIRFFLFNLFSTILLHISRPIRIKPLFNLSIIVNLIKTGAPIMAAGYGVTVANGFDRLLILKFGSVIDLGLYSPALAVKNAMASIPASMNQYITPRLSYRYGETNSSQSLWKLTWQATGITFLILCTTALLGWFLLPVVVSSLFPLYKAGLGAARFMLIAGIFASIGVATAALGALKAFRVLFIYVAA